MPDTHDGSWLAQIATGVAGQTHDRSHDAFLYSEMQEGSFTAKIFVDEGNRIRYDVFEYALKQLDFYSHWHDLPDSERWSVMRMLVHSSGKFTAWFSYPDELDVSDLDIGSERCDAAVRAVFGDKPIYYPPRRGKTYVLANDPQGFRDPLG